MKKRLGINFPCLTYYYYYNFYNTLYGIHKETSSYIRLPDLCVCVVIPSIIWVADFSLLLSAYTRCTQTCSCVCVLSHPQKDKNKCTCVCALAGTNASFYIHQRRECCAAGGLYLVGYTMNRGDGPYRWVVEKGGVCK